MVNVSERFHELATSDDPVTRVRIYTIDDTVNCTDDTDVQANGSLLVYDVGDTDSNKRIGQSGITLTDNCNKENEFQIGCVSSSELKLMLINDDGGLNDYPYGRFKIYIDVYDSVNEVWEECPFGVYTFERPTKRRVQLVTANAFDQMQLFDQIADEWFDSIDFGTDEPTLYEILESMANRLGVSIRSDTQQNMVNQTHQYSAAPFQSIEKTFREVLAWIAEAASCNARFDRAGYLVLEPFTPAVIGESDYEINGDSLGNNVLSIDIAEYTCEEIDKLVVKSSENDFGVIVGDGTNAYYITDNPFLYGATDADIRPLAVEIFNSVTSMLPYAPITANVLADWSIEAGDIIKVVRGGVTYRIPIFQQTLTWSGGYVRSELFSSGYETRPIESAVNRQNYQTAKSFHEFMVTAEQLLSRIETTDGDFSEFVQQFNQIVERVSNAEGSIESILDPDGAMWTFMNKNADGINELKSRIQFTDEPAIIMSASDDSIQIKISNSAIQFISGNDVLAYFTNEGLQAEWITAGSRVQIGNDDSGNWVWHKLSNGNFALDLT